MQLAVEFHTTADLTVIHLEAHTYAKTSAFDSLNYNLLVRPLKHSCNDQTGGPHRQASHHQPGQCPTPRGYAGAHTSFPVFSQPPAVCGCSLSELPWASNSDVSATDLSAEAELFHLHFLGGNTSWITAHPTEPTASTLALDLSSSPVGWTPLCKHHFLLPGYSPARSALYSTALGREVSMGPLQLLLMMAQQLFKTQQVLTSNLSLWSPGEKCLKQKDSWKYRLLHKPIQPPRKSLRVQWGDQRPQEPVCHEEGAAEIKGTVSIWGP